MMNTIPVFDPRGAVDAAPLATSPRVQKLQGLRLGLLDNTKWNANKLLRGVRDRLKQKQALGAVNYYRKESFAAASAPDLIDRIAAENDIVLAAIGD
jgi:hypothetical protein